MDTHETCRHKSPFSMAQMIPCAPPGAYDVAQRGPAEDPELALLGLLGDPPGPLDSPTDSFSEACAFLLAFNADSLCLPSPAPFGPCSTTAARSGSYSCEKRAFASSYDPRNFDHGQCSAGTPANFDKQRPSVTPWNPGSLPPKAVRRPAHSDTKLSLNSTIKGGVKKQSCSAPEKVQPFCIIRAGSRNGGATLQDLNATIMQMAQQAGIC